MQVQLGLLGQWLKEGMIEGFSQRDALRWFICQHLRDEVEELPACFVIHGQVSLHNKYVLPLATWVTLGMLPWNP